MSHVRANGKRAGQKRQEVSEKDRKKKEAATALLEKRKKYDPRKALKKAPTGSKPKRERKGKAAEAHSVQLERGYEEMKVSAADVVESEEVTQSNLPNMDGTSMEPMGRSEMTAPEMSAQRTADDQSQYPSVLEERKVPVRPFLKRKTQAVKMQKVAWKAKSRTDCWNKPEAPKKSKVATEQRPSLVQQRRPSRPNQRPMDPNQQTFGQNQARGQPQGDDYSPAYGAHAEEDEDDTVPDEEEESHQEFHEIKTQLLQTRQVARRDGTRSPGS